MSSFRFARSALRARPSLFSAPIQRRGYAEAVTDKIKLSLTLPHQVRQANSIYPSVATISGLTYLSPADHLPVDRRVRIRPVNSPRRPFPEY